MSQPENDPQIQPRMLEKAAQNIGEATLLASTVLLGLSAVEYVVSDNPALSELTQVGLVGAVAGVALNLVPLFRRNKQETDQAFDWYVSSRYKKPRT